MNIIWIAIVLSSLIYATFTGNVATLVNDIYLVGSESITITIKICCILVIWNSLFNILNKCNIVNVVAVPFKIFVYPIFKEESEEVKNDLSICFAINALGLGLASMPFMINCLKKSTHKTKILLFNLAPISIFPYTILSIRNTYKVMNDNIFWIFLIILTFIMYLLMIIYLRILKLDE